MQSQDVVPAAAAATHNADAMATAAAASEDADRERQHHPGTPARTLGTAQRDAMEQTTDTLFNL